MWKTPIAAKRKIGYEIPWCCGQKMRSQYAYRSRGGELYRNFCCIICKNTTSILVEGDLKMNKKKAMSPCLFGGDIDDSRRGAAKGVSGVGYS